MKKCVECEEIFDPQSPEKRKAGGLIVHCPDCSLETAIKVVGVTGSAGKMTGVEILKFKSEEDKEAYLHFWRVNSGLYKGKSCQMRGTKTTPGVSFRKVYENHPNTNHKGKK